MLSQQSTQPRVIEVKEDEVIISIPRFLFERGEESFRGQQSSSLIQGEHNHRADFSKFIGVLKDVPEFKGKTSVEVQHMITDIWIKNAMDYSSSTRTS